MFFCFTAEFRIHTSLSYRNTLLKFSPESRVYKYSVTNCVTRKFSKCATILVKDEVFG